MECIHTGILLSNSKDKDKTNCNQTVQNTPVSSQLFLICFKSRRTSSFFYGQVKKFRHNPYTVYTVSKTRNEQAKCCSLVDLDFLEILQLNKAEK